jgi:hypothetical protein
MANPIPHPALQHLQLTFTPSEYQAILERYTRVLFQSSLAGEEYWGRLPTYLIARCPLCSATYTSVLDTHGLSGRWTTYPDSWKAVFEASRQRIGCPHFVAVQKFTNLNSLLPTELPYYRNELDVPFVMPVFLPDDIPSVAVIHSLPICRIEGDSFVPRYATYMITYYSTDPKTLWDRRRAEEVAYGAGDPDYEGTALHTYRWANSQPESWDLPFWVQKGKLQWLSPFTPDLLLKAQPPEDLPYANIEGYRRPFTFRDGNIEFRP